MLFTTNKKDKFWNREDAIFALIPFVSILLTHYIANLRLNITILKSFELNYRLKYRTKSMKIHR